MNANSFKTDPVHFYLTQTEEWAEGLKKILFASYTLLKHPVLVLILLLSYRSRF